ncbi:hypothetical protein [Enterococcus dongliensis]|uniref:hypothetical protein n=1 Tax=Enterococcus dongliensis TaxID=2559925 RepID=UPI00289220F7|nr:hypothetical protein [Enterococcus dongliensis]MDT2670112.1 hypothetical protein [Enterococcus dongliensis]
MSYEVSYEKKTSLHDLQKNVIVNNHNVYKLGIIKEISDTDVDYLLRIECFDRGINVEVNLPHEIMMELEKMISDSLSD